MRRGFSEFSYLFFSLVYSKLRIPSARLCRFPIDIRGKKFIDFGSGLTTGYHCRLEAYPMNNRKDKILVFNKNIQINDFVHIAAREKVEIDNDVLIASKVFITDICHGLYNGENPSLPDTPPKDRELITKPVFIGKNVWIGEFVSILPGVIIGAGSVIGANSVVTKSIPANSIVVGNPARIIRQFNFETKRWEKYNAHGIDSYI